jgi:peptidoglycan/xylan/chitin deacetylase (PgdA/CDA1 family)
MPPVALSGLPADLGNLRVDDGAGPAYLEALAARLAERGAHIEVEEPEYLSPALLLERFHEWGRESISVVRSDASLLSRMEIGRWAETSAARRALDRASRALSVRGRLRAARDRWWARVASAEFWRGARSAATEDEWRWLTSSYTVLLYHRLAGELTPGQERVDVAPAKFDAQMALLRRLRFRPLEPGQLDGLTSPGASIGHRSMLVTVDDAFRDVVRPLLRHADLRPELFVPTAAVGGEADWLDGVRVASWEELRALSRSGVRFGGHSRRHLDLTTLTEEEAQAEIRGSGEDLRHALGVRPSSFAYPNGRHGERERQLVRAAGYSHAFATTTGRNGPGTDRYALNRVSVKAWDSRLSFLWKAFTGVQPPERWERWLLIRAGIERRLARAVRGARPRGRAASRQTPEPSLRPEP